MVLVKKLRILVVAVIKKREGFKIGLTQAFIGWLEGL